MENFCQEMNALLGSWSLSHHPYLPRLISTNAKQLVYQIPYSLNVVLYVSKLSMELGLPSNHITRLATITKFS